MTPLKELEAWCAKFETFRNGGRHEFWDIVGRAVENETKTASYLSQENSVLHEKVRKLEIALEAEREACAKLAQDYGISRYHYEQEPGKVKQDAFTAANSIAALIRGRE